MCTNLGVPNLDFNFSFHAQLNIYYKIDQTTKLNIKYWKLRKTDISSLDGEEEEGEEEEDKTLSKKDCENFVNPGAPEEAADHAETGPGASGAQKEKSSREGRFGSSSSVFKAKTEEAAEALKKTVEDAIRGTQKDDGRGTSYEV